MNIAIFYVLCNTDFFLTLRSPALFCTIPPATMAPARSLCQVSFGGNDVRSSPLCTHSFSWPQTGSYPGNRFISVPATNPRRDVPSSPLLPAASRPAEIDVLTLPREKKNAGEGEEESKEDREPTEPIPSWWGLAGWRSLMMTLMITNRPKWASKEALCAP